MTTITIKESVQTSSLTCADDMEAVETLLDGMGYILLRPVVNQTIRARLQTHQREHQGRELASYDNI